MRILRTAADWGRGLTQLTWGRWGTVGTLDAKRTLSFSSLSPRVRGMVVPRAGLLGI